MHDRESSESVLVCGQKCENVQEWECGCEKESVCVCERGNTRVRDYGVGGG